MSIPKISFVTLFILFLNFGQAQTPEELIKIKAASNQKALLQLAEKYKTKYSQEELRQIAIQNHWKYIIEYSDSYSQLVDIDENGKPVYYTTLNHGAGITARANKLYQGGGLGLNIQGQNMNAGIWDAGSARTTHELFTGRVTNIDAVTSHYHSTHVAGTIMGTDAVQNGNARGMAFMATADSYDWYNDLAEVAQAAANGLLISNHSYGHSPESVQDHEWGKYERESQALDEIMFNAPYYLFVCAAGNSRNRGFNSTKLGYDLLSGHTLSKNGIAVAALYEVLDYTGPESVGMSSFSSWGPTDDGRIKPDISAKGVGTFSASDATDTNYITISGTSMASPSIAGTLLLLQQYYNQQHSQFMKSATLKGLMVHNADEAGSFPGPDYRFGWGLINAEKAANVITGENTSSKIFENQLNEDQTFNIYYNAAGGEPLIATLSWTDPEGTVFTFTEDDPTPVLVNDLDLRIIHNGQTYYPWKLDVNNPANAATQGDNIVDNVEKIEIQNPSGVYQFQVSHKGDLQNALQNYSLIISGIQNTSFSIIDNQDNPYSLCNSSNSITFQYNIQRYENFTNPIQLSAVNLPTGLTATFNPSTVDNQTTFTLTLSGISSLNPGAYNFTIRGIGGTETIDHPIDLNVYSNNLLPPTLNFPANHATAVSLPVNLSWNQDVNAQFYTIEIATDANFSNIILSQNTFTPTFEPNNLIVGTHYYWRVKSTNTCTASNYSDVFDFTLECDSHPTLSSLFNGYDHLDLLINDDNSYNWEIAYVLEGMTPPGSGTVYNFSDLGNSYEISFDNLTPDTCYDFYIKSVCGAQSSSWSGPFQFCTPPNYCAGAHFYDSGGLTYNYSNRENEITTIYPANSGDRVRAVFQSFQTEPDYDFLYIYNGPDTTYDLIGKYDGPNSPGTVYSTDPSGALTFRFSSDTSVTSTGWNAEIICEPLPPCSRQPTNIEMTRNDPYSITMSWIENENSNSWEVQLVPAGSMPGATGTLISTNPYTISNLNPDTQYDFYIRTICNVGSSEWTEPTEVYTSPNYCGGTHFYDSGGLSNNYADNEFKIITIYPANTGERIKAVFNSFETEQYYDFLYIYNGSNVNSPLIGLFDGTNSPGEVIANNPSGALTFLFDSDGAVTAAGWDATIICETLDADDIEYPDNQLVIYPNPVSNILNIHSDDFVISKYKIYDMSGKLITQKEINDFDFEIDVSAFESNTYLLNLIFENGEVRTEKIIKQ